MDTTQTKARLAQLIQATGLRVYTEGLEKPEIHNPLTGKTLAQLPNRGHVLSWLEGAMWALTELRGTDEGRH